MGLFENLFKKTEKGVLIGSPAAGKCVSISEVPDPTFADGILGKGIAVIPSDGKIYAPANGVISTLFPTGHAIVLTMEGGAELLIHIGLETVTLKGKPFKIKVTENAAVKKGDLLIEADLKAIEQAGLNTITPMVICNSDDFSSIDTMTGKTVTAGDDVIKLTK